MYPVEYEVMVWNDDEGKSEILHGITFGESYTDAMSNIEKYYGNEIIDIRLFMNEENTIYEFERSQEENDHGLLKVTCEKWD